MIKTISLSGLIIFLFITQHAVCQQDVNSSLLLQKTKKLKSLKKVLYLAAHPDDENTRIISYMANEELARTAYLSLTRGDGGQNLIGTEKGALMGLLRTNELIEARKIDGAEQFFTRAVDFGYSKNPEETFTKWNRETVLYDVVLTIRKFQPDVIITRFPPTSRAGHGHHTASAILAEEAFDLASDSSVYPDQLKHLKPWKTKRLYFNNSTWWGENLDSLSKVHPKKYVTVDIGAYNALLGVSYSEMASESRSMHKSQGFGSQRTRGSKIEYLELIKGKPSDNPNSIFDLDVNNWSQIKNGKSISKKIDLAINQFDPLNPNSNTTILLEIYNLVKSIDNSYWKNQKMRELQFLIKHSLGLHFSALAKNYFNVEGENIDFDFELINRSSIEVKLNTISSQKTILLEHNKPLENNILNKLNSSIKTPKSFSTQPYWLRTPFVGMFEVKDTSDFNNPLNKPIIPITYDISIDGTSVLFNDFLDYRWTERVDGEQHRPFVSLPLVTANFENKIYIFPDSNELEINVSIRANAENFNDVVTLITPNGWSSSPPQTVSIDKPGLSKLITFKVKPPNKATKVIEFSIKFEKYSNPVKSYIEIEYPHITTQTLLPNCSTKAVKLDVKIKGKKVAYIMGAGDEIPTALKLLGYDVTMLNESNFYNYNLNSFDAILSGIRAYNTLPFLDNVYDDLMNYIENGGNYIIQYNTNRSLKAKKMTPFELNLSRDRVTVEEAPVSFIDKNHPILQTPNEISTKDFENWVQERGLYFPNSWSDDFFPVLKMNDPNESPKLGSLLVANYGKGTIIFTGLSFFRELPAGVPGAYRLFANIVSYKK